MKIPLRIATAAVAAVSLALGLAACGQVGESGGGASGEGRPAIGLLLVDNHTPRFEQFDKPLIDKRIKQLCRTCTVEYGNAQGDVATQQQQLESMITKGVQVLILDAVDAMALRSSVEKAHEANIPVVAYDRLVEGPISAYVSFNGEQVGKLQAQSLLSALGRKARSSQIVMMNGPPTHREAIQFQEAALSVLQGKVKIGKAYETFAWRQEYANANMSGAIATLGAGNIDGVYAGNDSLAYGVISALKAAKISPLPPVTGQDAELAALQRIVEGEQYMSVYKPFKPEAYAAAEIAVALARGEKLDGIAKETVSTRTAKDVPAVRLTPLTVTVHNIKDTVVKDGVHTLDQICTPKHKAACEKIGLTQ